MTWVIPFWRVWLGDFLPLAPRREMPSSRRTRDLEARGLPMMGRLAAAVVRRCQTAPNGFVGSDDRPEKPVAESKLAEAPCWWVYR